MPAPKKDRVDTIEKLAALMQEGFEQVGERLDRIEVRLDKVEIRLDRVETRLDRVEARLDRVEKRLDRVEERLDHIEYELSRIYRRFDTLEEQSASNAGFAKEIDALSTRMSAVERHPIMQSGSAA